MSVMSEVPVTGRAYRVCTDVTQQEWKKYSFWTLAEDIELTNGQTLQFLLNLMNIDSSGRVEKAFTALSAEIADTSRYSDYADRAAIVEDVTDGKILEIIPIIGNVAVSVGDTTSEAMAKINARFDYVMTHTEITPMSTEAMDALIEDTLLNLGIIDVT